MGLVPEGANDTSGNLMFVTALKFHEIWIKTSRSPLELSGVDHHIPLRWSKLESRSPRRTVLSEFPGRGPHLTIGMNQWKLVVKRSKVI